MEELWYLTESTGGGAEILILSVPLNTRVGTGIEPTPPTPPGMQIRTGRFPSVMVPVDAPLQGRSGTEF